MKSEVNESTEKTLINLITKALLKPVDKSLILKDVELNEIGLNSIGLVKLITEIEKSFEIELNDDFLIPSNFNSYSKIKNAVFQLLKG